LHDRLRHRGGFQDSWHWKRRFCQSYSNVDRIRFVWLGKIDIITTKARWNSPWYAMIPIICIYL
jgi:hypothetical protein